MSSKKMPKSLSLIGLPAAAESPVMLATMGGSAATSLPVSAGRAREGGHARGEAHGERSGAAP
jgi:hypothetical protein